MSPDEEYKLALAILSGIGDLVALFTKAKSGAIKPDDALAQIDKLTSALKANDASADAIVDERFPIAHDAQSTPTP